MAVVNPSCDTSTVWVLKGAHGVLQLKNVESNLVNKLDKSKCGILVIFLKAHFLKGDE